MDDRKPGASGSPQATKLAAAYLAGGLLAVALVFLAPWPLPFLGLAGCVSMAWMGYERWKIRRLAMKRKAASADEEPSTHGLPGSLEKDMAPGEKPSPLTPQ